MPSPRRISLSERTGLPLRACLRRSHGRRQVGRRRWQRLADPPRVWAIEGARASAALGASYHGPVLKVSEDGSLAMFLDGRRVWVV